MEMSWQGVCCEEEREFEVEEAGDAREERPPADAAAAAGESCDEEKRPEKLSLIHI